MKKHGIIEENNGTNNEQTTDKVEGTENNQVIEQVDATDKVEATGTSDNSQIVGQVDIFAIMKNKGIQVPDSIKVKEVKKETPVKKVSKTTPKKKEPERFELPIQIYYAGFPHNITKEEYPEKENLDRKEILHHLQSNFNYRVLTEKRTSLEYDKENNMLVVHLKNPSKGSFFNELFSSKKGINNIFTVENIKPRSNNKLPLASDTPYQFGMHRYGFDDNTVRFVKSDKYGYLVGPVEEGIEQSNLPSELPGAYFYSKIDSSYLNEIMIEFNKHYPNERLAQIFFNRNTNKFSLYYPDQTVTTASVQRYREGFFNGDYNNVLVMEIHSHGNYTAKFSYTDNCNELDFLVYGVIGDIGTDKPTSSFRLGFNGEFHQISIADVFDLDLNEEATYA